MMGAKNRFQEVTQSKTRAPPLCNSHQQTRRRGRRRKKEMGTGRKIRKAEQLHLKRQKEGRQQKTRRMTMQASVHIHHLATDKATERSTKTQGRGRLGSAGKRENISRAQRLLNKPSHSVSPTAQRKEQKKDVKEPTDW